MARPATPPTTPPAIVPGATDIVLSLLLLVEVGVVVAEVVVIEDVELIVAVARAANEATSTEKVLAEGLAEDNEE